MAGWLGNRQNERRGDFLSNENNLLSMIRSKLDEENKKLLIIPCSKVKKNLVNTSAIELYDGPFFRMIRKYRSNDFDILVLSAKYGMIKGDKKISFYDQKMTIDRANELSSKITIELSQLLNEHYYEDIYINIGKIYFEALKPSLNLFENKNVHLASGGIGMRLHHLRNWICQDN
ncbi:MAG: hypothetical protein M0R30_05310 [Methanoregula sp.]|jgi:hypothetical protein|uniref:DUF6884 domain-containing protein n=1 Tax=Methanoregula sp. TaxID=2052170 RepID=UPI0025CCB6B0|nr:DUF6884 domain-containing protein [Methanoregula sp.]MCK9631042.1 hypothetical protein [Methanoregula sp.]